jgi:prepilin-type N-terminal cleavage/methylation domain-containing protein
MICAAIADFIFGACMASPLHFRPCDDAANRNKSIAACYRKPKGWEVKMSRKIAKLEQGFTMIEISVVLLVGGVIVAFAAPRITNAMRSYRLSIAARQVADTLKRVKMQAVSENKPSALVVDTANRQAGMAILNDDGTIKDTYYVPLPQGMTFERPSVSTNPAGVSTSLTAAVSFSKYGSSGSVYRQDFNTRGFPVVTNPSDVVCIFVGNGKDYRAVTMSSVGGIRLYKLDGSIWTAAR